MKKIIIFLAIFIVNLSFAADANPDRLLNQVSFQLAEKKWVSTKTALLNVSINATLTSADLVKARAEIMTKLNQIAKGEWHLVQFDRSQDNSGLEKLFVLAQARINQSDLTDIYQHAKTTSKPGATYEINSVDFKPSLIEIQDVQAQLRDQLYQKIQAELTRLNSVYSGQVYTLYHLEFVEGDVSPQSKSYQPREMQNTMVMSTSVAPSLAVSNELTMTAVVQLASNRESE